MSGLQIGLSVFLRVTFTSRKKWLLFSVHAEIDALAVLLTYPKASGSNKKRVCIWP